MDAQKAAQARKEKADLERLAVIRKQREEAAAKKKAEQEPSKDKPKQ